jgi:hypothetical protein
VNDHLADEVLSAHIDDQLSPAEALSAHAHLTVCAECQARLEELRSVVVLVRNMPSLEPPREFALDPRPVGAPSNVIRLRRWYAVVRVGAASLAAAFVILSVGTLYVDSRPGATPLTAASKGAPAPLLAPDGVTTASAPGAENAAGPTAPAQAARQAAPAAAQAPGGGAAFAAQSTPAAADAADQVAAATSIRPLPTQAPTPQSTSQPFIATPVQAPQVDSAAPLRVAAAIVGVLTVVALFVAVLMRHRLRAAPLRTE